MIEPIAKPTVGRVVAPKFAATGRAPRGTEVDRRDLDDGSLHDLTVPKRRAATRARVRTPLSACTAASERRANAGFPPTAVTMVLVRTL